MAEVGILPAANWPERHRMAWEAGLRPPMFIDEAGPAARWRKHTIRCTAASYGRWLWFLREMAWLDIDLAPEKLADPARLRAYLEDLRHHNKPVTVLHRFIGLERALAVIVPMSDRSLLRRIINNLSEDYQPTSKREQIQESAALLDLGFRLMKRASTKPGRSLRRRSTMFRDGLQIALLALRPLRLSNFSSIEIGRHLVKVGGRWRLVFPGAETKNHKPIDVTFPDALLPALEEYLAVHRPQLTAGRYYGTALWVSYWWRAEHPSSLRYEICMWTERAFGIPVTPHRFRDSAATSLAVHEPDQVQIAHHVIGNDFMTMQRHYNQAKAIDAGRHFHAAMTARLEKGGRRGQR